MVNLKSTGPRNDAPSTTSTIGSIGREKPQNVVNLHRAMRPFQASANKSGNKATLRNRNSHYLNQNRVNQNRPSQNRVPQQNFQKPAQSAGFDTPTRFIWPYKGPILRNFNQAHLKGIDIKGQFGMPVKAAAGGTVVYSGNGLKGYGNLIIIKHNENFLTAYAHNEKLMVKEGERVSLGQEIAKVGKTGTDSVKLHFEIRYKGKPIDPLRLLPKG